MNAMAAPQSIQRGNAEVPVALIFGKAALAKNTRIGVMEMSNAASWTNGIVLTSSAYCQSQRYQRETAGGMYVIFAVLTAQGSVGRRCLRKEFGPPAILTIVSCQNKWALASSHAWQPTCATENRLVASIALAPRIESSVPGIMTRRCSGRWHEHGGRMPKMTTRRNGTSSDMNMPARNVSTIRPSAWSHRKPTLLSPLTRFTTTLT